MADYVVTSEELTKIAQAIRDRGQTSNGLTFPDGYVNAISALHDGESSPNGTAWELTNSSLNFTCVEYGDGVWCAGTAGNGIYSSTDGKTWSLAIATVETVHTLCYSGRYWFAGIHSGLLSSENGLTWSPSNKVNWSAPFRHIVSDHGTSIAVSDNGWVCCHDGSKELAWSSQVQIEGCGKPFYANNTWIIGAKGKILVSKDDGVTWIGYATQFTNYHFTEFAYGNGVWIGTFSGSYQAGLIIRSTDEGENWTETFSDKIGWSTSFPITCAYKDGMFLVSTFRGDGLGGAVCYSYDGSNWTLTSGAGGYITKLFKYNGVWVGLASISNDYYQQNGIYYSVDGMYWNKSNAPISAWADVAAGKNEWVAVGSAGSCHSATWEPT